jgi:hypothetical protein
MRERCTHSIYLILRSANGKKLFEFDDQPSNLLICFSSIEKWMNSKIRNPFVPCEISAVIKDQDRNKVYELKDQQTELIKCMTPIHAFCEVKLGIHYTPIVPKFRSFGK